MRSGTSEGSLMGDSCWLGVISAPASFTALKVVPGGVFGGRLSIIRLVWFTTGKIAIERAATIVAITTGFRSAFHPSQRLFKARVPHSTLPLHRAPLDLPTAI